MRLAFIAVITLGLAACGPPPPPQYGAAGGGTGPGGKPAWVDNNEPMEYPDHQYMRGVGRGPSRAACDSDAYAALSKIFNAQIHQVSQDWQGHFSKVSNLGHNVKIEAMSISQLTRVSTDKVLKGAKVAAHWAGEGTHHCLAVLPRMPTAQSLRDEIGRLDAEIKAQVKRGDEAATATAKFMAYARAMEVMQEREALNVDLRIVDPRKVGVDPPVNWAELVAKFTGQRSKIRVGLRLTGTKASTIQTCLAEELGKSGIEVLEGTSDVDVIIHGKLKYEKAGIIRGSHMVRADVSLRLTDMENGRTLSAFAEDIKVGRPTLQRSVQLAVSRLCKNVMPELVKKLKASFH